MSTFSFATASSSLLSYCINVNILLQHQGSFFLILFCVVRVVRGCVALLAWDALRCVALRVLRALRVIRALHVM